MNPDNKAYLERFRDKYNQYKQHRIIAHFQMEERREFLRIARAEWDKNYISDITCGACMPDLLTYCFIQMDKEPKKAENPANMETIAEDEIPAGSDSGVVKMTFHLQEPQINTDGQESETKTDKKISQPNAGNPKRRSNHRKG